MFTALGHHLQGLASPAGSQALAATLERVLDGPLASWHPVTDDAVVERIVDLTPEWVGIALIALTQLGSVFVVVPLAVAAYWWAPDRLGAWLPAVFAYYGLMASIKSLNSATRPEVGPPVGPEAVPSLLAGWYDHSTAIATTSFPSGNVMVATVVAGLFVTDLRIGTIRSRAAAAVGFVTVVAYSRLGLGVHYPIDVLAGIALGLALLAVITLFRRRIDDDVAAVYALAFVLAFASVWLRSNGFGVPDVAVLEGSNRVIALGGALGGLLVWRLGRATDWRFGRAIGWRFAAASTPSTAADRREGAPPSASTTEGNHEWGRADAIGIGVLLTVVGVAYVLNGTMTHPLVTLLWAAAAFGAVVAIPHVVPGRLWVLRPRSVRP